MALKKCRECGGQVSRSAKTCPHCGKRYPAGGFHLGTGGGCLLALLLLFFGPCVVSGLLDGNDTGAPSPAPSQPRESSSIADLNATVIFNGTQFVIANRDSFDWTNVKLEINSKTFSSGYTLRTSIIEAGETYTVGAMQFAKSDGERFNPFTHKATNLSVWCDTPKGKGFYYGTWE